MSHKEYCLGFYVACEPKFKVRSSRYRGCGRPRKTDYDMITLRDMIRRAEKMMVNELNTNIWGD